MWGNYDSTDREEAGFLWGTCSMHEYAELEQL